MHIPKKYFQDRSVLLLISINLFLTLLCTILILFKLDNSNDSYIVQYRPNLGLRAFTSGSASTFIGFILFSVFILVFHTLLSMRVYHIRRHFSVALLGLATLLLALAIIVSNALLLQS